MRMRGGGGGGGGVCVTLRVVMQQHDMTILDCITKKLYKNRQQLGTCLEPPRLVQRNVTVTTAA